jgi:thioredoxin-like negative regulator of GroEL
LEALTRKAPDINLRRVDIGSWDSAVAAQYQIRSLPTVWIYENGALVARDRREVLGRLRTLLER